MRKDVSENRGKGGRMLLTTNALMVAAVPGFED